MNDIYGKRILCLQGALFLYVTLLFVLIFLFIPCGSCMKDAGVEKNERRVLNNVYRFEWNLRGIQRGTCFKAVFREKSFWCIGVRDRVLRGGCEKR